jgi:transposase InsO family protein
VAPDLIGGDFTAPGPGQKLVGDITYLRTGEGWLYLATVIDLATRMVVGWQLASHMRTSLVTGALGMAIGGGHAPPGAVFHSDKGAQGEFNRSSQHLDHGGSRWDAAGSSCRSRRRVHVGSGRRIGRCARRCGHRAGLSPHVRCNGSSGG